MHQLLSPFHGNYCMAVSLPENQQIRADLGLSALLALSPVWAMTVGDVNQYLACVGGLIGISIGAIRLYRLIFVKKRDDGIEED